MTKKLKTLFTGTSSIGTREYIRQAVDAQQLNWYSKIDGNELFVNNRFFMNIYKYLSYRDLSKDLVRYYKKMNPEFTQGTLAEFIGVHSPFLSRVFAAKADLSQDQAFRLCEYFEFNTKQADYFFLLLEHERTALPERRRKLRGQIEAVQQEQLNVRESLDAEMIGKEKSQQYLLYYSHPLYSIIHSAMHIERYQTQPQRLREDLNLSHDHFKKIMDDLLTTGILDWDSKANRYRVLKNDLHLESGSPLVSNYRTMMRVASLQRIQNVGNEEKVAVSATISVDRDTRRSIHREILRCISRIKDLVEKAEAEEVLQLNFDFFPWLDGKN